MDVRVVRLEPGSFEKRVDSFIKLRCLQISHGQFNQKIAVLLIDNSPLPQLPRALVHDSLALHKFCKSAVLRSQNCLKLSLCLSKFTGPH